MTLAAQSGLLIALLAVCCIAPGFFFIRRLRWNPMEKFCGAIGLSIVLVYLTAWLVYLEGGIGTRMPLAPLALASVICGVLGLVAWRDMFHVVRSARVKRALLGYIFLLVWAFLLLGIIRVYSGAGWNSDWQEHLQRALFFLWRFPVNTSFVPNYPLPARPPLMNVLAAYFLGQTEDRFELLQIVFTFLNLLIFLPCCLILPVITRIRRPRILPLLALFALNPMVMQNATYAWTKSLAAFFVVLGLALYLAAWRKCDQSRMIAAFLSLAAGILVHYSAGPYVVFLTFHYVFWLFWRRPNRWRELATVVTTCTLLLATWFAWSTKIYGNATFLSNTTVTSSQQYQGSNVAKILANTFDSIVPFWMRDRSLLNMFQQPNSIGRLREIAFLSYQTNMVFGMGLAGGPVALWLSFRRFRRRSWRHTPEGAFWTGFVLFCAFSGIAVVGERDNFGVAQLTLMALEVLGIAILVSPLSGRRILGGVLMAGCLIDFSLGILLHAHIQSLENDSGTIVFAGLEVSDSGMRRGAPGSDALSEFAWENWFGKHQRALSEQWLKSLPEQNRNDPAFQSGWPAAKAELLEVRNEDEARWGGWYSRHNGEIEYIGDHITGRLGEGLPVSILLIVVSALSAALIKQRGRVSLLPLKASPPRPSRQKHGETAPRRARFDR